MLLSDLARYATNGVAAGAGASGPGGGARPAAHAATDAGRQLPEHRRLAAHRRHGNHPKGARRTHPDGHQQVCGAYTAQQNKNSFIA